MGTKRPSNAPDASQKKKKFKLSSGFLDPSTSGIYATCARKHEKQAVQELGLLFEEKLEEIYGDELKNGADESADEIEDESKKSLSIEDDIKRELEELKEKKIGLDKNGEKKKEILQFIDLNCECVIFCKTRKPVVPEEFVRRVIKDLADPSHMEKRTRYIQKLTPITSSCSSNMDQLIKLAERVLAPHFHNSDKQQSFKFAVEVTRRNFNALERLEIINQIVSCVLQNGKYEHQVDLKNYDKLILVECFKSNIGMSVVDGDYATEYKKYNVQQIYEKKLKDHADK
ncbi:putative tRNA acetyltransferase TDEL_0D06210 [Torulaspora delbrueckii]|uniref:THUMP domain-containing protein n=1 Tax=Torulaspora delbrueckii TaxID=4950 RepID=G8ZUB1_TORDE|nr:hypothetical protein TDEL_0D06210 [Torulaspora delbrueckii]CCE92205.1 hypothetical protein TDEL_0D06210 [Torulaspora delbrueckii]